MGRRTTVFTALLAMALLLAGCSVSIVTRVDPDGSGVLGTIYIFPEGTFTCQEAKENGLIPRNLTVTQDRASDGDVTCTTTTPFNNLRELAQLMDQTDIVSIQALAIQDYTFSYSIDVFPREQDAGIYSMYWSLVVPGRITDHNADSVDGNMLFWELQIGERNRIYAQSALPVPPTPTTPTPTLQADSSMWPLVLGALAVGGIGFYLFRRQRGAPGASAPIRQPGASTGQPSAVTGSLEERLQQLRHLRDQGLISEEEFMERRNTILGSL